MVYKLVELKRNLRPGQVYRRADLGQWSTAVDRHLSALVKDGTLQKLRGGLYYFPTESVFGKTPPDEHRLVQTFLKDDHFLLTSPNDYNSLGVGTTQLYNKRVVYNHKRHGEFKLGGKIFTFVSKHRFPKKTSQEFLLIDLLNNLDSLAEDHDFVLKNVSTKLKTMDMKNVKKNLSQYGSLRAKSRFNSLIEKLEENHEARLSA